MTIRTGTQIEIEVTKLQLAKIILENEKDITGKPLLTGQQKQAIDAACADKVKPKGGKA